MAGRDALAGRCRSRNSLPRIGVSNARHTRPMTSAPRQLPVLRLLHAHRLMDTPQVHAHHPLAGRQVRALAFEHTSRRACEICLPRLHRRP